jgi:hypothetical protein
MVGPVQTIIFTLGTVLFVDQQNTDQVPLLDNVFGIIDLNNNHHELNHGYAKIEINGENTLCWIGGNISACRLGPNSTIDYKHHDGSISKSFDTMRGSGICIFSPSWSMCDIEGDYSEPIYKQSTTIGEAAKNIERAEFENSIGEQSSSRISGTDVSIDLYGKKLDHWCFVINHALGCSIGDATSIGIYVDGKFHGFTNLEGKISYCYVGRLGTYCL